MDKKEYIKQLKQLIKIFHPDLNTKNYLEEMYNEITKILVNKLNEVKENDNSYENKKSAEKDYFYYKLGIKYYRNIHPDKFYKRNLDSTYETKTYNEFISVLNKIYLSFNLAEYYFKKLINEYPKSAYFQDSNEKIDLLKKLYKSYEKIIFEERKTVNYENFMNEMGLKIL
ncbi:MAG: hypothetical protein FWB73_03285 [Treponema sp.]|nr:hypothetical protein [Treponema sp.]